MEDKIHTFISQGRIYKGDFVEITEHAYKMKDLKSGLVIMLPISKTIVELARGSQ